MKLSNRLTVLFLGSMAAVLFVFSVSLYWVTSSYLNGRQEHRLLAGMQTLVASTEIFEDHVEWEPLLRRITLGQTWEADEIAWTVHSSSLALKDSSRNLESSGKGYPDPRERAWRLVACRLRAGIFEPEKANVREFSGADSFLEAVPGGELPGEKALPVDRTFSDSQIFLTIGVPAKTTQAALMRMTAWLFAISIAIWLLAFLASNWVCTKALSPVFEMAQSARLIQRDTEKGGTLLVPTTGDELEELGSAFNNLLTNLQNSLDRQRNFAGDASHQLRTPLAAIMAAVDVTLKQERSQGEYRKTLEVVRGRVNRLTQIIESLLQLARLDNQNEKVAMDWFDLPTFAKGWLVDWAENPRFTDIRLKCTVTGIAICANQILLRQIMDNLLDNAIKYSEPGSTIEIALANLSDRICISVSDHGCGIPPDELQNIFNPFFRSSQTRHHSFAGVGLGLTVAGRLAKVLGCQISASPNPGGGSVFQIVVPKMLSI